MSTQLQTVTCQRCGSGFVLTTTYSDMLARWGAKVVVPLLCPTCFLTYGPLPKKCGEIKWFNPRKHYGFIISDDGEEVFFHERQLLKGKGDGPYSGQAVRFHAHYAIKGPEALNVELVG